MFIQKNLKKYAVTIRPGSA